MKKVFKKFSPYQIFLIALGIFILVPAIIFSIRGTNNQVSIHNDIPNPPVVDNQQVTPKTNVPTDTYTYGTNIPAGMLYTSPLENLPSAKEIPIKNALSNFFMPNSPDQDPFICRSNSQKAQEIKYFDLICPDKNIIGCAHSREALVCGNQYVVYQYTDGGPTFYGPFAMPN